MTKAKTTVAAAKPAGTPKPPKKLIPRTAPKPPEPVVVKVDAPDVAKPEVEVKPAELAPAPAPVKRAVRKPTKEDEVVAKHQKVLAEALVEAQAISYAQPVVMRQEAKKSKKKPEKSAKPKKVKLVRDCFAMPEQEYARIAEIKKRLSGLGYEAKKSEILRGGVAVLAALNDAELKAVMARIERIKTGRPAK
jgi:DNA-binding transcriptional regulator YiaG